MSTALREGVRRLEVTTRLTLAVLALASGVYTYLGVRELLSGNAAVVFFAAVIYAVAVAVGIYAFWSFLMRFLPHVRDMPSRLLLLGCMALGSVMILAMSAWLNASALAGSAAIGQHLATTLQGYTRDLDKAHANALATQGLLPDIQLASSRFARLADAERTGSLTGTSGSGTVVQLLAQMSSQLESLGKELVAGADRVKALHGEGAKHLAAMRELVSDRGPIGARVDAFGREATALAGVIASLQQTSLAPAVNRTAEGLAGGFIAPAPGGATPDLAARQTAVVDKVQASVAAQAAALAGAADKVLALPSIEPTRFQPLSAAEAVLLYASDFLPSWAGAIAIDLMPGVLVLILCAVHAGIRREGVPEANASSMSAAELLTALRLARDVEAAQAGAVPPAAVGASDAPRPAEPPAPPTRPEPAHEAEENVTPFLAPRGGKKE